MIDKCSVLARTKLDEFDLHDKLGNADNIDADKHLVWWIPL
jgi:hypothetical protein